MPSQIYSDILALINQKGGYIRTKDILKANIHNVYLNDLIERGQIVRVKRGLYRLASFQPSSDFVEIAKIIPEGIFCLASALSYHDMSTYEPSAYQVAVPRQRKIFLPKLPPIQVFHFSQLQYNTGIEKITVDNNTFSIYDKEKSICDCIRFRNRIGIDIMKEAIVNYLQKPGRDIQKLLEYAKVLHVYGSVKQYFEMLV